MAAAAKGGFTSIVWWKLVTAIPKGHRKRSDI
jgi:hypothetical protein